MHVRRLSTIIPALLALGCAAAVDAASYDAAATTTVTRSDTPHPVAENDVLVDLHMSFSAFEGDIPDNPLHGMDGECFGSGRFVDGVPSEKSVGHCIARNGEDEIAIITYRLIELKPGDAGSSGTWSVEGGTGRWANASGGGDFDQTREAGDATAEMRLSGTVEL